jgi:hypothetical protein
VTRRARGDGGLYWDEHRQRWIATTTIGYDGRGKRVVRKASGRTRTEAKNKLRDLLRDQADGWTAGVTGYTVRLAVEDSWRMGWVGSRRRRSRSIATCVPSMCCRRSGHGSCGTCLRRRSISGLPDCHCHTAPERCRRSEPVSAGR